MFTRQVFCAILSLSLFLGFCSSETAKAQTQEEDELKELTNRIRRDKFDLILPQVMREHNIDMWIHVIREGDTDFFGAEDLGSYSGVFIFTDRGGDRIERAILGRRWKNSRRNQPPGLRVSDHTLVEESGAYDIIGEAIEQREIKGEPYTVYDFRFVGIGALDIGTFVDERNPKRIALNYLENLGPHVGGRSYDGISYTDYRLLVKAIGEKYAKRLVSSEYLIADYLSRPVESELVMYKKIRQWIEESMERDFAKIVPGVTKVGDLEGEVALMRPGRSRIPDDYVFQGGDLFLIDHGAEGYYDLREEGSGYWGLWQVYNIPWKFGNFFELKAEYGYVLREGETDCLRNSKDSGQMR